MKRFIGEKAFVMIGLFASIISLAFGLWSMHKSSEFSRRMDVMNERVVDLTVRAKGGLVEEKSRGSSQPRLDQFRERRAMKQKALAETKIADDVTIGRPLEKLMESTKKQEARKDKMARDMRRVAEENTRIMEEAGLEAARRGATISQRSSMSIPDASILLSQLTPPKDILPPDLYPNPPPPPGKTRTDDVDLDDLERDIRLMGVKV